MNIDVLDEDGASNIAHPDQFEKDKTVYFGSRPVSNVKTYPKERSIAITTFKSVVCGSCGRSFSPSEKFYQSDLHQSGCEFQG